MGEEDGTRGTAPLLRGRLETIQIENEGIDGAPVVGRANFISDEDKTYDVVSLSEVVSCAPSVLIEKEAVEGILYEDCIFGIVRTVDLYLDTKLGVGHKERPKLNLTVKKDRGGKIMAQSDRCHRDPVAFRTVSAPPAQPIPEALIWTNLPRPFFRPWCVCQSFWLP